MILPRNNKMNLNPPDWLASLSRHSVALLQTFLAAIRPPSRVPIWQWLEANYDLIPGKSALPGRVSFEFLPASRFFFDHAQDYRCSKNTEMVCHQSGKTENSIMLLCWMVVECPMPLMWVMANADQCEDFGKDRLYPAIENCAAAFALAPKERERWTRRMVQLDSMTVHLRGSNARGKLKSSPIGKIIADERSDWKHGSIGTLRERLTTFSNSQEISMGTPGVKDDELHTDWKEGSQTFMHFNCIDCGHSQPFRFGKEPSVLFPDARTKGGLVWPANEETKPDGEWDLTDGGAVERLTRLECEKCGRLYQNSEKVQLLKTVHEHHRNPDALPAHYSSSRNVLMMPWAKVAWGRVAVKFLKAKAAMKRGDLEPMKTFIQEDLGEPWELPSLYKQKGDLLERIGSYKMGEYWLGPDGLLEKDTALILTADRQLMYLVYVVRQVRKTGGSRLVHRGKVASLDDLRARQMELKIRNQCVWCDDGGGQTAEFRQKALQWGWNILKGEDFDHFVIQHKENGVDKSYRQGWRKTEFDPGIGTTSQGRATKDAFLWSNVWYKDKLFFMCITGKGPLWEIPSDIDAEYLQQMTANEYREKTNSQGVRENYWHVTGADHFADCELEMMVVLDIGGLGRFLEKAKDTPLK